MGSVASLSCPAGVQLNVRAAGRVGARGQPTVVVVRECRGAGGSVHLLQRVHLVVHQRDRCGAGTCARHVAGEVVAERLTRSLRAGARGVLFDEVPELVVGVRDRDTIGSHRL